MFSLGAAALGFPEADGCRTPSLSPPGPFLLAFQPHAQADTEVLQGLFTACKSGQDMALQLAPHLTVFLSTDQCLDRPQQLTEVRRAFKTRGARPTGLKLRCGAGQDGKAGLHLVLPQLEHAHITELDINAERMKDDTDLTLFLLLAAPLMPHLHGLTLDRCPKDCELPPPTQLPALTSLALCPYIGADQDLEPILRTAAAYLPKLKALSLSSAGKCEPDWALFFTAAPKSPDSHTPLAPHLTHFTTTDILLEELLGLLLTWTSNTTTDSASGLYRN